MGWGASHSIQRFGNLTWNSLFNAHNLKKPKKLYLLALEKGQVCPGQHGSVV